MRRSRYGVGSPIYHVWVLRDRGNYLDGDLYSIYITWPSTYALLSHCGSYAHWLLSTKSTAKSSRKSSVAYQSKGLIGAKF